MVSRCGVLALQGAYAVHAAVLRRLGVEPVEVRVPADLSGCDALVLPGGESSTMLKLLRRRGLWEEVGGRLREGVPALGTCAGLILLAAGVEPEQPSWGVLDVDVVRNAHGRQVHSSVERVELSPGVPGPATIEGVFIRAPGIRRVGPGVEVLGTVADAAVLVRCGPIVAATFHPELGGDDRLHRLLVEAGQSS